MSKTQLSRRDTLKVAAAAGAVTVLGVPRSMGSATASQSSEVPTLTATADIPNDTAIQITIDEYDSGDRVNTDTVKLDDGTHTYNLDGLDGDSGYEYDFEIELGSDDSECSFRPRLSSLSPLQPYS